MEKVIREVKKYTDQIGIMEPFLVNAKDDKLYFYDDLYKKIIVLRSLAKKYSTEYIALDGRFAERSIQQDELLSNDGIHPTELGQEFIVEEFIKIINKSKS